MKDADMEKPGKTFLFKKPSFIFNYLNDQNIFTFDLTTLA
jgi:hypothetical protein